MLGRGVASGCLITDMAIPIHGSPGLLFYGSLPPLDGSAISNQAQESLSPLSHSFLSSPCGKGLRAYILCVREHRPSGVPRKRHVKLLPGN